MAAERIARGIAWRRGGAEKLRAIIFEDSVGWEKPCGGGLSFKALRRYPWLFEESNGAKRVREAEFIASNGKRAHFRLRQPLIVYSRAVLNRLLLRRAEETGAEIIQERVLGFERTGTGWLLKGSRDIYRSDFLVLANGARSRLRRLLVGDFKADEFMLTFGYYVPAEDQLLRVQFFDEFEGYGWAFPRSDHLSVGICGKAGENRMAELRCRLHDFMQEFGYPRDNSPVFSHLLPNLSVEGWSSLRLAGKGWALVGDAAGLVDSVTGEGIYYAMRSGELLAESLLRGTPEDYPVLIREEFGRTLALGARLAPFFYRGDFLGGSVTTRTIDFAQRSETFMGLLQDLIEGSQTYQGLIVRLHRQLGGSLVEIVRGSLRAAFSKPGHNIAAHPAAL